MPDLSKMLRDGLPYLTRNEGTEVQLALAVSVYAHSKSRHEQHDHSVKVELPPHALIPLRDHLADRGGTCLSMWRSDRSTVTLVTLSSRFAHESKKLLSCCCCCCASFSDEEMPF